MWQGLGLCMALMVLLAGSVPAAVIRPEEQQETTTEMASTTVEPEVSTTRAAVSRDEEASVQIELTSVEEAHSPSNSPEKSAKLLLLSTPAKRPSEVEQQLEEQDNSEAAGDAGSGDGIMVEQQQQQEQQQEDSTTTEYSEMSITTTTTESSDRKTTKLFAINATISSKESMAPNVAVAFATDDNATISIAEQPQSAGNNNVAIELALVEPEAEYVLLDSGIIELHPTPAAAAAPLSASSTHDELQLGSFTHIDSAAHLQPVVHSIEIVPTRLDDPLIVNYVHNLR